jgi:hypothetical protein
MRRTFEYVQDSGHGWLRVSLQELEAVGLTLADITPYSYRKHCFDRSPQLALALEEDADMVTFMMAYFATFGRSAKLRERHVEKALIRNWYSAGTCQDYRAVQDRLKTKIGEIA